MSSETLNDWIEWHRLCDLDQCQPETQERLAAYGRRIFIQEATKEFFGKGSNAGSGAPASLPDNGHAGQLCWTYVQDYLLTQRVKTAGKTCKAYICDNALGKATALRLAVFRAGFKIMTRNVVRAYYGNEIAEFHRKQARELVSIHEPTGANDNSTLQDSLSREDLAVRLPLHELTQEELRDFTNLAKQLAPAIWEEMSDTEKTIIWAALQGWSLASPTTETLCGLKKSQCYEARKKISERVTRMLNELGVSGDAYAEQVVKMFIAVELEHKIFEWKSPENEPASPFREQMEPVHE